MKRLGRSAELVSRCDRMMMLLSKLSVTLCEK